ncbi:MAG: hypothetical protein JWM11_3335 [Planctomycetaceae bacterium]|nr:hypothetical protein [Planctomycetaceae bacterium]
MVDHSTQPPPVGLSKYCRMVIARSLDDASKVTGIRPIVLFWVLIATIIGALYFSIISDWSQAFSKFQWQVCAAGGAITVLLAVAVICMIRAPYLLHRELLEAERKRIAAEADEASARQDKELLHTALEKLAAPNPALKIQRKQINDFIVELQQLLGGLNTGVSNCAPSFYTLDSQIKIYVKREIPAFTDYAKKPAPKDSFNVERHPEELKLLARTCEDRIESLRNLLEFLS